MSASLILPLLTAFGLGSIVTALVQSCLSNCSSQRQRSFEERKTSYIGLPEAYHRAADEGTDEAAKEYAYWQMMCELVALKAVRDAIERMVETNDDQSQRNKAHEALKEALRTDLVVSV